MRFYFLTLYQPRGFRENPDSATFRTFEGAQATTTPGTLADRPGPFLTTQGRYVCSWCGRGRPRATPSRACCLSEDNQRLSTQEGLHLRDLAPCTAFWRLSLPKVGAMEGPSGSHGHL